MKKLKLSQENSQLFDLFWPIMAEQALTILVGMVSTMLVSNVGAYAVAGVNLVDTISQMIIIFFNALASGATVMVAQHIGAKRFEDAGKTAAQATLIVVALAAFIGFLTFSFAGSILSWLYGGAADNVLQVGRIYMRFSAVSYIFLGLFSVSAGATRAAGDSKTPMLAAFLSNIVNLAVASILIFGFKLEVYAVSVAVLAARMVSGVFMFWHVKKKKIGPLVLPKILSMPQWYLVKPVLNIGVPSGIDSLIFQGAKVLVSVFLSGMGTKALQAHAIANSVGGYLWLVGNAMQVAAVTVVGQAYGARQFKTAKNWMRRLLAYTAGIQIAMLIPFLLLLNFLISLYAPVPETAQLAAKILKTLALAQPFVYGASFVLPQCLRATGDARNTMVISVLSLIFMRLALGWFLAFPMNLGVYGIWLGTLADWVGRGAGFAWRMEANRWHQGKKPVDEIIISG